MTNFLHSACFVMMFMTLVAAATVVAVAG